MLLSLFLSFMDVNNEFKVLDPLSSLFFFLSFLCCDLVDFELLFDSKSLFSEESFAFSEFSGSVVPLWVIIYPADPINAKPAAAAAPPLMTLVLASFFDLFFLGFLLFFFVLFV
ncbi:hypothetical protein H1A07_09530 (plasmid) [Lactobacillus taiwanensis]|nr:hypothetical protein H1A07_09530 [Lactobacillus taiwanensis]